MTRNTNVVVQGWVVDRTAQGWTGIDDPYEVPAHAEIILDTVAHDAEANLPARPGAQRGEVELTERAAAPKEGRLHRAQLGAHQLGVESRHL